MEGSAKKPSVRTSVLRLAAALLLALLTLGIVAFAASNPQWVADRYLPLSRAVCGGLAACVSFLPLSAAELLCYLLIVWAVVFLVRTILRVVRGPDRGAAALRFVSHILLLAAVLAALFFSLWGLNYYAPPLAERMGLPAPDLSTAALRDAALRLAEELNAMAPPGAPGRGGRVGLRPL